LRWDQDFVFRTPIADTARTPHAPLLLVLLLVLVIGNGEVEGDKEVEVKRASSGSVPAST
jgi:hypothetical protein